MLAFPINLMITEKEAIRLFKKYSTDKRTLDIILKHSKAVQKSAAKIAKKIKIADKNFIKTASLLHDIGRFECPPGKLSIRHGIVGAAILRKEGLPKYALVAERHLGAGISKLDIKSQGLNLPLKDYIPKSIEEKVIAHADNLVDSKNKIRAIKYPLDRFRKELGELYAKRILNLQQEIEKLKNSKAIDYKND